MQAENEPAPRNAPIPPAQQTRNLDGIHVLLGVGLAVSHLSNETTTTSGNEWDSAISGHLVLTTISEASPISLLGLDAFMSQYGGRDGGRVSVGPVIGTRRFGPLVGLGLSASAEWDLTDPPKWGASATAWLFAGLVPFVSLGRHERSGTFLELGLRISLPALRLGRHGFL